MDTKRMLTGMILAMAVILGYKMFIEWLWKKNNWKDPYQVATTQQVIQSSTQSSASTNSAPSTDVSMTTAPTTNPTASTSGIRAIGGDSSGSVTIGSTLSKDPNYVMGVDLLTQGAAIDNVALNQFKLEVGKPGPYSFEKPPEYTAEDRALATRSVTINGQTVDLANVHWTLEGSTKEQATYAVEVQNGESKLARIRKTYRVDSQPENKGKSEGYELTVTFLIENLTAGPVTVSTKFNGPLSPRPETERGPDRNVIGGYDNAGYVELNHRPIEELTPEKPTHDFTRAEKTNHPFVWGGIGGTYFDSILRPIPQDKELGPAPYIQNVVAESIHPDPKRPHPLVRMTYTTADQTIPANGSSTLSMKLFCGPKARDLLQNSYYSAPLIRYVGTLVMASGVCGYCAIDWLINFLVWLMGVFHMIFRDWGLAIIGLVCLVRLILHPITKKSQVNMMKMGKMGPEMERLKKKYGDDKEAMTKAQMEMYKTMGFTPVLGCLPMFLQMPIFISLWQALQSTFELRHAPFLWGFTWIKDLSQPDRLIPFGHSVPLIFGWHIDALNILPILVAIVSFLNMKYTPRPPAATPEAEQQQKMMQWMTLIFPLMFYTFPSGLNIYYLTSTSLGIWEGKRIRAHIKEQEEAEKAGKVIVDATPRSRNRPKKADAPTEAKGGLAGWIQKLQDRAQQVMEEEKKRKKNS